MTEPKKYFVRFSNIDDHDKLMEFYAANPHKNVCDRNEEMMRNLADNGSITIIEAEDGTIVGASISYPLMGENDPNSQKWLEIGTTRIVMNGYPGLFDVMIAMQTLRAYLVEPPEERFVCQMESPAVRKMAARLGFRPYMPSDELVRVSDATLTVDESAGNEGWFSAGPEALPVLAKRMLEAIDQPHIAHLKTGEQIKLDFSKSKFFKVFEDEFRNLATRDFGNPDTPDYKTSIAKNRQSWMRWYFK